MVLSQGKASSQPMLQQQVLQSRYRLEAQRGHTGAGRQTWLATDLETQERVILKLLAFNPQIQWQEVKLFERESQILQHLDHPRIPRYRDYFALDTSSESDLPWFVLVQDYIPGESLQERLERGELFTEAEAIDLAGSILALLVYLHEISPPVFHRDIKPSNLIRGEDGQYYLVDFGAVQDRARAEGASFTVVGTSGYAAPEQLWGNTVAASDLYALGATLVHLLTGIPPADLPQRHLTLQFRDRVNLSQGFGDWLEQLLAPSPDDRFQSARQAFKALDGLFHAPKSTNETRVSYGRLVLLSCLGLAIGLPLGLTPLLLLYPTSGSGNAREAEAKTYLGSINRVQQGYFLEKQTFAASLPALELGIQAKTDNYRYSIVTTPDAAFVYGISRKDNIRSYVGAVFVIPGSLPPKSQTTTSQAPTPDSSTKPSKPSKSESLPADTVSITCQMVERGEKHPPTPTYQNGQPLCPAGTIALN